MNFIREGTRATGRFRWWRADNFSYAREDNGTPQRKAEVHGRKASVNKASIIRRREHE